MTETNQHRFVAYRQRPTHDVDEFEDLGPIGLREALRLFEGIDWRNEAAQANWAQKTEPTILVSNENNGCDFRISAHVPREIIWVNPDGKSEQEFDAGQPWITVRIENAPDVANVVSLASEKDANFCEFTTLSLEQAEECLRWFFEGDYLSLYKEFRWM